ncbi:pyridoxal phosphate-dependent aminotransferase [Microbacterium panaciterrae]|uniref:Aminotransferase class I/II-fold pyridoxal phosphate-dependent enzyme n=1 Tax=Microbacterium panaciterrae TaxID=985759 RepID=A0ABP8PBP3_9MICO
MTTVDATGTVFVPAPAVQRVEATSRRVQQPSSTSDLVSLAVSEPDFDTPQPIVDAAHAAAARGRTHYAPMAGDSALRDRLAAEIAKLRGQHTDASDILVTQGGTAGLSAAILATIGPGDRVVIPDPTYSLYADLVSLAGGEAVHVPLAEDLHWNLGALRDALPGARMFVFCNPGNPTGIVHSREEIEALAGMLEGTDTIVLADEAYAALSFTDAPFTSALEVPALDGRTIYCQTFSKNYAMTGWRVGYLWGPTPIIEAATRVHGTFNGSLNTFVQDAAIVALDQCAADIDRMRASYLRRREIMREALAAVPGLDLSEPEGAFYFFPRYDAPLSSIEMVAFLRENGVAVRPGSEFGPSGEGRIRLSYAASDEAIITGVARMADAMRALRSS